MINELIELDRLLAKNRAYLYEREAVLFTVSGFKGISELSGDEDKKLSQETIEALSDLGFPPTKYFQHAHNLIYLVGNNKEDIRSLIRLIRKSQSKPLTLEDEIRYGGFYGYEPEEIDYYIYFIRCKVSPVPSHCLTVLNELYRRAISNPELLNKPNELLEGLKDSICIAYCISPITSDNDDFIKRRREKLELLKRVSPELLEGNFRNNLYQILEVHSFFGSSSLKNSIRSIGGAENYEKLINFGKSTYSHFKKLDLFQKIKF